MSAQSAKSGDLIQPVSQRTFRGGRVVVPDYKSKAALRPDQMEESINVDTSSDSIRKMRGFQKVTTVAAAGDISTIFYDEFLNTVFVTYSTKWAKLNGTTFSDLTGATGFTANSPFIFARLGDYLVGVNGVDQPKTWNNVATAAITTMPATWTGTAWPRIIANWMGRLFAAGPEPDILYFSKLFDANVWTPGTAAGDGGAIRIGNDGAPITALVPYQRGLLIFKTTGLYILTGENVFTTANIRSEFDQRTFDWQEVTDGVDCVGQRAWIIVGDRLFVWGRSQVFEVRPDQNPSGIKVTVISHAIASDVSNITSNKNLISAVHYADRKQIWFCVAFDSGSTTIDAVHVYDYDFVDPDQHGANGTDRVGAWMLRQGYSHKTMANIFDSNGKLQIYSGGYNGNGHLFLQNSTLNYDGVAMECIAKPAFLELAGLLTAKSNRVILLLGESTIGEIAYSYAYDYSSSVYDSEVITPGAPASSWNSTGIATWGSAYPVGTTGTWLTGEPFVENIRIYGRGRSIQHRFYSKVMSSDFDILAIMHPVTVMGFV